MDEKLFDAKLEKINAVIEGNDKRYSERFNSQDKAVSEAFLASQTAIEKSEKSAEKRSDAVYVTITELQKTLGTVIGRNEFEMSNKNQNDKLEALNTEMTLREGQKSGVGVGWSWIIGIIAFMAALIALVLNAIRLFSQGL